MDNPQTITKLELAENLYFLNRTIKETQAQAQENPHNMLLRQKVRELYDLKNKVLVKMLSEGHIKVKNCQTRQGMFFSFALDSIFAFHVPRSTEVKEAVKKYARKKA